MPVTMMITVVLLPILGGILIMLLPFKNRKQMLIYIESLVLINSALVIAMLLNKTDEALILFRFTGNLQVSFRLDGLGVVFAAMAAVLWPTPPFPFIAHLANVTLAARSNLSSSRPITRLSVST